MNPLDDVITAIATPIGEGGISVIRVSGKGAITKVDRCFRGKNSLQTVSPQTAHFGYIVDQLGKKVDEVIATVFHAPHSYTAEDSVEISCHGGIFVTKKVLDTVLSTGTRLAEPGEFTKRAFLNGRIDLSKVEAVADIIHSQSEQSLRASLSQLEGRLSTRILEIREKLINVCSVLELELDFSEEGFEIADNNIVLQKIRSIASDISQMADSYSVGRVFREGIKVVLAGKTNVGKSSIFNSLLSENRAIVTAIPGTTRDVIEENLNINGLLFRIIDTAGLRSTTDQVEIEGIKLTEEQLKEADLVLYIVDAVVGIQSEDINAINDLSARQDHHSKSLLVFNKMDLVNGWREICLPDPISSMKSIQISAKTGKGIPELKEDLAMMVLPKQYQEQSYLVTNQRHKECLVGALDCVQSAINSIGKGKANEIIAFEIRAAMSHLESILGIITTDDILNNIFTKFCIGK